MPLLPTRTRILRSLLLLCCGISTLTAALLFLTNARYYTEREANIEQSITRDNETGADTFIVPNIVHYIRWEKPEFSFVDYICVRSAYLNHDPDKIIFHTNLKNFSGVYWTRLIENPDFRNRTELRFLEIPTEIFGQKINQAWRLYHGSDIARIRILTNVGGIYLDNDVYVVNSLDKYRRYEMTLGWDEGQFLGTQVIIAYSKAKFLPLWLETYKVYKKDLWYYNAGERPTTEVLQKHPELVHRVKLKFGVHMLLPELYHNYWPEWRKQDCIHLLINHRSYLDMYYKQIPVFTEDNIRDYNRTFGEMAREVL